MPLPCDRCHVHADLQLWVRVFPNQDRVRLCNGCSALVRSEVDERGHDGEDSQRFNQQAARLGGDVWRTGDAVYWFRFPPGVKSNGRNGNGARPALVSKREI